MAHPRLPGTAPTDWQQALQELDAVVERAECTRTRYLVHVEELAAAGADTGAAAAMLRQAEDRLGHPGPADARGGGRPRAGLPARSRRAAHPGGRAAQPLAGRARRGRHRLAAARRASDGRGSRTRAAAEGEASGAATVSSPVDERDAAVWRDHAVGTTGSGCGCQRRAAAIAIVHTGYGEDVPPERWHDRVHPIESSPRHAFSRKPMDTVGEVGSSGERGEARGAGGGARGRPEAGGEAFEVDGGRDRHVPQVRLGQPAVAAAAQPKARTPCERVPSIPARRA